MRVWIALAAIVVAIGLFAATRNAEATLTPSSGRNCNLHATYDGSDNGSAAFGSGNVGGGAGQKVYICGYVLGTGGTATNLKLVEGSNSSCSSNAANLTPAWQLTTNATTGFSSPYWTGMVTATAGDFVCINASAGNAHQAEIWYALQ